MADPRATIFAAEAPSLEDWRFLVEKTLAGRDFSVLQSRTRDGIRIEPLYQPADAPPLLGRGGPWTLVQIVDDPDPDRASEGALEDLKGGATGLALRLAGAPSAAGLGLPATMEAIRIALEGIDLAAIHIRIDPHREAPATACLLRDLVLQSGAAPERTNLAFGLDPIGPMAFAGPAGGIDPERFIACFQELRSGAFRGPLAELDARVFHEAGASEAQELAAVLAAAAWWLRALDNASVSMETAVPLFGATVAVDRDQFLSIAKLRALRLLWSRLLEVCGAPPSPLPVHAETSRRMMTCADAHTNLLRTTIAAFAAGVGGADSVMVLPYNAALGLADRHARALARNIQHLLMAESHLHRVADPAAGSGAVEALTEAMAERAWTELLTIEAEGGIIESLRSGLFPARIAQAQEALRAEVRGGGTPLVGATIFADPAEPAPVDRGRQSVSGPLVGLVPIQLEALAQAA